MALPQLTDEQRKAALAKAAKVRQERAQIRQDIKAGKLSVNEVLENSDNPVIGKMKVSALLKSIPGYGKAKAEKLMLELGISDTRKIQGLGSRQKAELLERF